MNWSNILRALLIINPRFTITVWHLKMSVLIHYHRVICNKLQQSYITSRPTQAILIRRSKKSMHVTQARSEMSKAASCKTNQSIDHYQSILLGSNQWCQIIVVLLINPYFSCQHHELCELYSNNLIFLFPFYVIFFLSLFIFSDIAREKRY